MIYPRRHPPRGSAPDSSQAAGPIQLEGAQKSTLETGRTRLVFTGLVFALAFSVIALRLGEIGLIQQGHEPALSATAPGAPLETGRADILDRNGMVLATTLPTASLSANPRHIGNAAEAARLLAPILTGLGESEIRRRLSANKQFVWLERSISPRQQYAINRLGIPGLQFQEKPHRVYPQGALASHVVGFADVDNNGLSGIERGLDTALRGTAEPLFLSIDLRVQHLMTVELKAAMAEFRAIGAAGLVLDAVTGELISLVSLPDFDPADPSTADAEARFNRATLGTYEMGSVFKIFTTAMVLDRGYLTIRDGYDTSDPIRVARFTIRDFKPKTRWLSVPEIFIYSSNIGTVHMAMAAGTPAQQEFLSSLGLLDRSRLELDEVGAPLLPATWREINTMTIAYGHGIAVTALQLASAVATVVNGGRMVPPTLLKRDPAAPLPGRQVLKPETSEIMRRLMRLVVTHGTGRNANAEGYLVGGKTGTADKLRGRRYARDARIASFVGAFPMNDPRYVVFAMIDEPKGHEGTFGYATGGWVAAPVVKRVVAGMAPLLGIKPQFDDYEMELENETLLQVKANPGSGAVAAN